MDFTRAHFEPRLKGTTLDKVGVVCNFPATPHEPTSTYIYDEKLELVLNVALATGRPLLLAGEPGCGKTTLARNVAHVLDGAAYYQQTIGSRTQAGELLWQLDTLGRLNDAYSPSQALRPESHYVQPGMLWWALAPNSARRRGLPDGADVVTPPVGHREIDRAVLLIDEIDKAEPDLPNDLLEVLDTRSFGVLGRTVGAERQKVLIVITTNLERELPGAFLRRCVVHRFEPAGTGWYSAIALQRFPGLDKAMAERVEEQLLEHRRIARERDQRVPGTAEYLDAIEALRSLAPASEAWAHVERCLFDKQAQLDG